MARLALLVGFFVVPTILLMIGHRLRERTPRQRGAFWGGIVGHSIALLVAIGALHYPPVIWTTDVRIAIGFWSMLLGGAVGAAIGALRARPGAQPDGAA
jgi:protein-S-isoprenylcysteine O-methyltransferase Ste14